MPRPSAPTRRRLGRLATLAAVGASALTLSGCIVINATQTSQPQSMGPLRLTVNMCANGSPGCTSLSSNGWSAYGFLNEANSNQTVPAQLLFAVRLPVGATPPETLQTTYDGSPLTYTRSASYETELEVLEPAPAGERWWGWLSGTVSYGRLEPQALGITLEVALPRGVDGAPLPSPLRWRPVVGVRQVDDTLPSTRPVKCGNSTAELYSGYADSPGQPTIYCIDFPSQETARGYLDAPLTDFGVTGSEVQAPSGSTVTATFLARRSGAPDAGTTFSLSATSGVPGGSVSLDRETVSLGGDSTQPVLATVRIPAATPAGRYPVTITATAPGKPTRTGTSTVTVDGPPSASPVLSSASLRPKRFRAGSKVAKPRGKTPVGTTVGVTASTAVTLAVTIERKTAGRKAKGKPCSPKARRGKRCSTFVRTGSFQRTLRAGPNSLRFTGKLGRKKLRTGKYRMVLVGTGSDGRASGQSRLPFTITRR